MMMVVKGFLPAVEMTGKGEMRGSGMTNDCAGISPCGRNDGKGLMGEVEWW